MQNHLATQIIILGGTGDLSQRKLLPALMELFVRGQLPAVFSIIGLARSEKTVDEYRTFVHDAIKKYSSHLSHSTHTIEEFCEHISYISGSFNDLISYAVLKEKIELFNNVHQTKSNKLFYLAVPPKSYSEIFSDLKSTGVADEGAGEWTHILVEKPFGDDFDTAQKLDTELANLFREDQIFRIDHYLAKEAVQNILSFRFANSLFKAPWDKDSVESVHITMSETIDVGHRAGFYEGVGALRDVGQNHLLQLLALVVIKEPATFSAEAIRTARCEVLQALKPIPTDELEQHVLRAQYEHYRTNDDVPNDSETETYFELKAELTLQEWAGVPFFIRAGKALDADEVSITINMKDAASKLFETESCSSVGNKITLQISPEQSTSITINTKAPGLGFHLETNTLSFTNQASETDIKNSYEKVLYDSIVGDHTLFTRTEEVLAAWKFITPIIQHWHTIPLHTYKKGGKGPTATIIT